jgi:hypothetical protein
MADRECDTLASRLDFNPLISVGKSMLASAVCSKMCSKMCSKILRRRMLGRFQKITGQSHGPGRYAKGGSMLGQKSLLTCRGRPASQRGPVSVNLLKRPASARTAGSFPNCRGPHLCLVVLTNHSSSTLNLSLSSFLPCWQSCPAIDLRL